MINAEKSTVTVVTIKASLPPLKEFFLPSHLHNIDPSVLITGLKHFIKTKVFNQPVSLNSIPTSGKGILPPKDESDALELVKSEDAISRFFFEYFGISSRRLQLVYSYVKKLQ